MAPRKPATDQPELEGTEEERAARFGWGDGDVVLLERDERLPPRDDDPVYTDV